MSLKSVVIWLVKKIGSISKTDQIGLDVLYKQSPPSGYRGGIDQLGQIGGYCSRIWCRLSALGIVESNDSTCSSRPTPQSANQ